MVRDRLESIKGMPQHAKLEELEYWADSFSLKEEDPLIIKYNEVFGDDRGEFFRGWRIGPNTLDGLESVTWDTLAKSFIWVDKINDGDTHQVQNEIDAHYSKITPAVAFSSNSLWIISSHLYHLKKEPAVVIKAAEIAEFYPHLDDLPDALPSDLELGTNHGRPLRYSRTQTGFVLYHSGNDGVDDGFIESDDLPVASDWFAPESSSTNDDYGYVITYLDELQPDSAGG